MDTKLKDLYDILFAAGQIKSRSINALADAACVGRQTLHASGGTGRISRQNEDKISALGNFDPNAPYWCDLTIPEEKREVFNTNYRGADTPEAFRKALQSIWGIGRKRYKVYHEAPVAAHPEVACHELTGSGQGATLDLELPIFLEADFGAIHDLANNLKYGFRRARLRVDLTCKYGSKSVTRFATGGSQVINGAEITSRGIPSTPSWEIQCLPGDTILAKPVSKNDEPLMAVVGYGEGTRINSTLSVNLSDGELVFSNGDPILDDNKAAVIERICTLLLQENINEQGRLDLSFHSLQIKEADH
ncbi:hypothetical protein [Asticcacaulis sp. MM231]|uniref:hypothetical protein n=1 Tax=Asticcacaulis sp. MM231 TaxID=3157666 RepID=UPI0032D567BB